MPDQREPIEPFDTGMLDVGRRQQLYYEQVGNPAGKPMVILHGGPGGGCSVGMRRNGDPTKYRIVLFDQRGCGRSHPHAADHDTSLGAQHHHTPDRRHRAAARAPRHRPVAGVRRLLGHSLGLAYAEQHPDRVSELVLLAIFLSHRTSCLAYGGLRRFLPIEYEAFRTARRPGCATAT